MFKPVVRFTIATLLWKHYRRHLIVTLSAVVAIVFIVLIHQDYLHYAEEISDKASIGLSFVLKWAGIIAIIVFWLWGLSKKPVNTKKLPDPLPKSRGQHSQQQTTEKEDDPFASLRSKPKLRSRADIIIEEQKPKN